MVAGFRLWQQCEAFCRLEFRQVLTVQAMLPAVKLLANGDGIVVKALIWIIAVVSPYMSAALLVMRPLGPDAS